MAAKSGKRFEAFWRCDESAIPQNVWARRKAMVDQAREMREANLMYLNLASGGNVDGSGPYGSDVSQYMMTGIRPRKNLLMALVDTAASRIAVNRTLPFYQTSGADFSLAYKAEQKARVLHHQMQELGAFTLGVSIFYDAANVGSGAVHVFVDPITGRPKIVRCKPNSIAVDLAEDKEPRTWTWEYTVPRDHLEAQHPELAAQIAEAKGPDDEDMSTMFAREDSGVDPVKVIEAWHLPSRPDANDGMHVICVSNAVLHKAPYTRQRPPFASFHCFERAAGFWGQGYVERALEAQVRHWYLQTVIDRCQDLGSNLVFLLDSNSDVLSSDIDNLPGVAITYQGGTQPPQAVTWQGTPADLVQQQDKIWYDLLEQEGFAAGTVSGELPQKGLSSARAVRAATDVSSQRHVLPIRRFEQFYLQVAQLLSDANDDCAEIDPNYEVNGYNRTGRQTFLTTSKWADLSIKDGDCRLNVFPMSDLPQTPAAKLQALSEYAEAQYMSKAQFLSLIEMPDLDAWQSLETAPNDLVEWQIERLKQGQEELPIPQQLPYLEDAKRAVNSAFLIAYRSGAPQEVQDVFLAYLAYADELLAGAQPPPAPEPGPEQPPPDPMMQPAPQGALAA